MQVRLGCMCTVKVSHLKFHQWREIHMISFRTIFSKTSTFRQYAGCYLCVCVRAIFHRFVIWVELRFMNEYSEMITIYSPTVHICERFSFVLSKRSPLFVHLCALSFSYMFAQMNRNMTVIVAFIVNFWVKVFTLKSSKFPTYLKIKLSLLFHHFSYIH